MPAPLPGCPRCHRNDRVQVLEPGDEVAARSRIYEAPNHHCLYCAELFEYDAKEGKYAPFRIRTVAGEITNTVFEPALGPGDAAFAWKSAERRMSEARAAEIQATGWSAVREGLDWAVRCPPAPVRRKNGMPYSSR